jgi:hypothetical protein
VFTVIHQRQHHVHGGISETRNYMNEKGWLWYISVTYVSRKWCYWLWQSYKSVTQVVLLALAALQVPES